MPQNSLRPLSDLAGEYQTDLKYATRDNFTGQPVYQFARGFIHHKAFDLLKRAISLANHLGYGIKIYDAYRPPEVQYLLFDHTPDPNFLAHPERGSPHGRGIAVDLTLYDRGEGAVLDMGTDFDSFCHKSYHGAGELSVLQAQNRYTLLGIMITAGFDYFRNEWWHYQLHNASQYPLVPHRVCPEPMLDHAHLKRAQELAQKYQRD